MIVVDASVLVNMLLYADERGERARHLLVRDPQWTAPEHWRVEVFSAARGLTLGHKVSAEQAAWAVQQLPELAVDTVPVSSLLPDMWSMRDRVSGYDAAYVALARQRRLTLVTADRRLASTAAAYCRVEYSGGAPVTAGPAS